MPSSNRFRRRGTAAATAAAAARRVRRPFWAVGTKICGVGTNAMKRSISLLSVADTTTIADDDDDHDYQMRLGKKKFKPPLHEVCIPTRKNANGTAVGKDTAVPFLKDTVAPEKDTIVAFKEDNSSDATSKSSRAGHKRVKFESYNNTAQCVATQKIEPVAQQAQPNSALERVQIVNAETSQPILANTPGQRLENDSFRGQVFVMIRTPDMKQGDHDNDTLGQRGQQQQQNDDEEEEEDAVGMCIDDAAGGDGGVSAARGNNHGVHEYFRKCHKTQFALQLQIQFKKLPPGPLYIGFELGNENDAPAPLRMNPLRRALSSTILKTVTKMNPSCHYSFGSTSPSAASDNREGLPPEERRWERPHVCFGLERTVGRFVVTPPHETPPTLGEARLRETIQSIQHRQTVGHGSIEWNSRDTYSLCCWTPHVDWTTWSTKGVPLPGMRTIPLSDIVGKRRPIHIVMYALKQSQVDMTTSSPLHTKPSGVSENHKKKKYNRHPTSSATASCNAKHYQCHLEKYFDIQFASAAASCAPSGRERHKACAAADHGLGARKSEERKRKRDNRE